jgi:O-antigen ligase
MRRLLPADFLPFRAPATFATVGGARVAQKTGVEAGSLTQPMFLFVLLVSASYWYCLPVASQTIVRYSEFRGYDVLLAALILLLLLHYRERLANYFRIEGPGRRIYLFSLWATATYPVTIIISFLGHRASWSLVTLIFLFHLWGFALLFATIRIFVTSRRQCLLLLDTFLILGALEAGIICLQALGFLPRFWSDLYAAYGQMSFSGTLGPNRTMPGHAMVLVLAVAMSYGRNFRVVGVKRVFLAIAGALLSIAAVAFSASRTSWTVCAVLLIFTLVGRRPHAGLLAFVMIVAVATFALLPESAERRISEIYRWRVSSKLDARRATVIQEESDTAISTLEKLDGRRVELWTDGIAALIERPHLIPFGGGFNNYRYTVGVGVSAHNLYITLIGEVGLIGLFLYLSWLRGLWRESSMRIAKVRKWNKSRRSFVSTEMQSVVVAFMVSLLAGEILYPYRPAFTIMGMFLFVSAVLNHRALVYGDSPQNKRSSRKGIKARTKPVRERGSTLGLGTFAAEPLLAKE